MQQVIRQLLRLIDTDKDDHTAVGMDLQRDYRTGWSGYPSCVSKLQAQKLTRDLKMM